MAPTTIIHHLERHAAEQGARIAYRDKLEGHWRSTSWAEFNRLVRTAAKAMVSLGLGTGDVVTILGANRPEWSISALAAMRVGGISAGIYTTCSPEEISYIVGHAESKLLVVETLEQYERVASIRGELGDLQTIVLLSDADKVDADDVLSWDDFMAKSADSSDEAIDEILDAITGDQVADFIYTSGTTGPPKAVMLTHENLVWTAQALGDAVKVDAEEVGLSYLPLSHIAEQSGTMLIPLSYGYEVWYCHNGLELADYLKDVRPTVFFGVPRVWERIEAGVSGQLAQAEGAKAKIAEWAMGVGTEMTKVKNAGGTPGAALKVQYGIAEKLFFSKIKAALGFDRCKFMISGAAPIPRAILEFYGSLDMGIIELYGQSEDTGPTTTNLPGATKYGTVGRAVPGVEVKLSEEDEILVRGKNVFAGYYKNQEATDETLIDGWLHSGDLGAFDDDGFLSIIGRKKDIIITSGGKNIAPQNIEELLSGIDLVSHAVVIGEQQRFLVTLLTLEPESSAKFAEEHGLDVETMHESDVVRSHIEAAIKADVNPQMARVEHVRNFVVLPGEFSTDGGELTPTFKVKRKVVNEKYADQITALYDEGQLL